MSTYTPPLPGYGPLSLKTAYTPPLAGHASLSFGSDVVGTQVSPTGISSMLFGSVLAKGPTILTAQSLGDTTLFGDYEIRIYRLRTTAEGFDAFEDGNTTVQYGDRRVQLDGWEDTEFGLPWADFYTRYLGPEGFDQEEYGDTTVAGGVRVLDMSGSGFDSVEFSDDGDISLASREVFPDWWVDTSFGTPLMGYARYVYASSVADWIFGDATVFDNTIHVSGIGADTSAYGSPTLGLYKRYLGAASVFDLDINNIGFPKVFNLRQIIAPAYRSTEWIEGGVADGLLTSIRNVNRIVDLIGNGISPLFRGVSEGASLDNNARLLKPTGFDATEWGVKTPVDGTFIGYRVRKVFPVGWEPNELSTRFHIVRNFADQIFPLGFDTSAIGVPPLVANTRRTFYVGGLGVQTAWGMPFIAPGVRTLRPAQFQQSQEIMGGANVWYRVRSIAPTPPAFPNTAFGIAALDIHFNIVAAKSIPSAIQWGTPQVVNNTPEVKPYWDSDAFTLFGRPNVFNKKNYFNFEGSDLMQWGLVLVEYRTKNIQPMGFDALRPNMLHKIQNLNPDPPENRFLEAYGLDSPEWGVPNATNNGLLVEGMETSAFGTVFMDNRGIFPVGITPPYDANGTEFGTPSVPYTSYINPESVFIESHGKPRLSPYTITVFGATEQAIENNGFSPGDYIDGFLNDHSGVMPAWGDTRVELQNRVIFHYNPSAEDALGTPDIGRNPQYITPGGKVLGKFGYPELFGGNRSVMSAGFDLLETGLYSIDHAELRNRVILQASLFTEAFGDTWVSNFIRELPLDGLDATVWGEYSDTIVQRPPPPAEPNGLDATVWGNPMVAYRIRPVYPEGFDSFVSDYSLGNFRDRMRVTGRIVPMDVTMGVQLTMGMPLIETGLRGITAPSVGDTRDQLGMPVIHRQNRVSMVSAGRFDAWGDAWVMGVEHGLIAPRGDDASAFGQPRMRGQIRLDGWIGAMGVPRLAKHAGAEGIIDGEFGAAVLLGFGCGKQARVMHGFDSTVFGTAQVSRGT